MDTKWSLKIQVFIHSPWLPGWSHDKTHIVGELLLLRVSSVIHFKSNIVTPSSTNLTLWSSCCMSLCRGISDLLKPSHKNYDLEEEPPLGVESSTTVHITRPHSVVVVTSTKDAPGSNCREQVRQCFSYLKASALHTKRPCMFFFFNKNGLKRYFNICSVCISSCSCQLLKPFLWVVTCHTLIQPHTNNNTFSRES